MTNKNGIYQLSPRKVLTGIDKVGLALTGAGLGTSAYFNDPESFEGNTIAEGTLDLQVDWQEHYSYPQVYGFDDSTDGLDVTRPEAGDASGYVGCYAEQCRHNEQTEQT